MPQMTTVLTKQQAEYDHRYLRRKKKEF